VSLQPAYFDRLYADSPDPWSLGSRWYEQRKYALTVGALSRRRYRRGFEPGCSVGVLTEQLAARCDTLLATDVSPAAVAAARRQVNEWPGATVVRMQVPQEWPTGRFDLLVFSEVGYYLSLDMLDELINRAAFSLTPDGEIVLVHWRHPVSDYPLLGDTVHDRFLAEPRFARTAGYQDNDFRLDVLTFPGQRTVAET
jgi:predicted TPR repeat methyltransferase